MAARTYHVKRVANHISATKSIQLWVQGRSGLNLRISKLNIYIMGMMIDNMQTFKGMTKKERIWQVLSQFVDNQYPRSHFATDEIFKAQGEYEKLDFATENIWQLIIRNYGADEAPLPNDNKAENPSSDELNGAQHVG
jgi:hypothetical protein